MPSRSNSNLSPFEHLFKRSPDYSFLRVFGCQCFPYLRPYNNHKMDFRSTPCIFLGYSPTHHGYRCLDISSDKLYIARHVRFNEHLFPFIPPPVAKIPQPKSPYYSSFPFPSTTPEPAEQSTPSPNIETPPPPPTPPTNTETPTQPPPTVPPPTPPNTTTQPQPRTRPSNLRPNPQPPNRFSPSAYHTSTNTTEPVEPTSFTVANKYPEWRHAMLEEYNALVKNNTWSLVPYVENTNVIDSKWVYRIKKDQDGNITRHKARLVAKGFHQQAGIDFQETFSPVIKATTIRVLLTLATTNQWPLRQLDAQNAFNG